MLNRRQFGQNLAAASPWQHLFQRGRVDGVPAPTSSTQPRRKIAFLGTEFYQHSHAQHILDRFAMGYASGGKWHQPRVDVASMFIDQVHENDISRQRISGMA